MIFYPLPSKFTFDIDLGFWIARTTASTWYVIDCQSDGHGYFYNVVSNVVPMSRFGTYRSLADAKRVVEEQHEKLWKAKECI